MFSDLYSKAAELASLGQPFAIATVVRVREFVLGSTRLQGGIDQFRQLLGLGMGGGRVRGERGSQRSADQPRNGEATDDYRGHER